jgi:hypothetical protein
MQSGTACAGDGADDRATQALKAVAVMATGRPALETADHTQAEWV